MMLLSIIIPAYNVERYLTQCLDSIFCQDTESCEVLCIDDGSTDRTPQLLEQYEQGCPNLRVITQPNQGMSAARNCGLKEAKGEYVWFVDSDDWICEDAVATLLPLLNGEDVVGFNTKKYIETTKTYIDNNLPSVKGPLSGWDYFNRVRLIPTTIHFVCIWQRVYRRAFLQDNHLRFDESVRRAEDDLFTTLVMLHAKSVIVSDACLYVYRIRPQSITTTVDINRWYDSLKVQEFLTDTFIPMHNLDKTVIYQVLASFYINCFSSKTKDLYGNRDRELRQRVNWDYFKETCVTSRHRRLYRMIRFSPVLYRCSERINKKLH